MDEGFTRRQIQRQEQDFKALGWAFFVLIAAIWVLAAALLAKVFI
jgi:hypothetical protein